MKRLPVFVGAALVLLSCNDGKIPSEPAEQAPPSTSSKAIKPAIKVQPSEASLITTMSTSEAHDPKVTGSRIQCFSGTTDGDQGGVTYGGTCRRTPLANRDLAELYTMDGDPDGSYAGVWATPVLIRGKRLGEVQELSFSYAGGPPGGGSPRWSVAIDENGNGRHEYPEEQYAFADVNACNDGDSFVGQEDAEDDGTCGWFYKAESFTNWDAFAGPPELSDRPAVCRRVDRIRPGLRGCRPARPLSGVPAGCALMNSGGQARGRLLPLVLRPAAPQLPDTNRTRC
jgi:hypothetical protein